MRTTSFNLAAAFAGGIALSLPAPSVPAQEPQHAGFVARANVTVDNSSPVPQLVAGTNVPPFELLPYRQAQLAMNAPPPAPGSGFPVRFHYSIGQAPGPQCHGTIDMTVALRGTSASPTRATNCVAHSLGTGGARCNIAVSARNSACEGGLAFVAP
jgi:hypothetical protein